jgi:signal peptidase II
MTVCCVGCDQITKEMASTHLPKTRVLSLAGGAVKFDYTQNKGAVLSFEYCLPEKWRGPTLTALVSTSLGLLILYVLLARRLRPVSVTALALLCGGSLSNLLDRVAPEGVVVDFLSLGWGGFRTAIFNIADAAISMGAMLLVLNILLHLGRSMIRKLIQPAG